MSLGERLGFLRRLSDPWTAEQATEVAARIAPEFLRRMLLQYLRTTTTTTSVGAAQLTHWIDPVIRAPLHSTRGACGLPAVTACAQNFAGPPHARVRNVVAAACRRRLPWGRFAPEGGFAGRGAASLARWPSVTPPRRQSPRVCIFFHRRCGPTHLAWCDVASIWNMSRVSRGLQRVTTAPDSWRAVRWPTRGSAGFDTLAAFRHTLPAALRAAIDVGFERTDLATFRGVLLALCAPGPTGDDDPRSSPMGGGDDGGQRSSPAGGGDDSSISGSVQK
jgi:hypothetical protein